MKKLVEVSDEGLIALMGENVTFWCFNYIYTGKLIGVNDDCVLLDDAKVVYETGPLNEEGFKDAQPLPAKWYVMRQAIESFGVMK
jgi:hypothetical protein